MNERTRRWLRVAALALAAGAVALGITWSGIVPLAASSGHWKITEWFLHFTMRRTVKVRSLGTTVPPLDDPSLVVRAAGHFDRACRPCHGGPGAPRSEVVRAMTPEPPELSARVPTWQAEELFWIVKHGVKFTGMPGWPAQERDDEVWAMVAFLRELPEMTPERYRTLAHGEAGATPPPGTPPEDVVETCARCHGPRGLGRGSGGVPRIAGQKERYLYASLVAYALRERASGIMGPVASGLDDRTMRELARYYAALDPASQRPADPEPPLDPEAIARGEEIARRGVPERGVPSCSDCHGPSATPRNPIYPEIAGLDAEYLRLQLELFAAGHRGGTPYAHLMRHVASRLGPDEMEDAAAYYASLTDRTQ